MIKIEKKIVGYAVARLDTEEKAAKPEFKREGGGGDRAEVIRMHEKLERPEMLVGSTYKVRTPISDHAMYVTINDIVLNKGTEYEKRRPFEIFINSKNLDHYQWRVQQLDMTCARNRGASISEPRIIVERLSKCR